MIVRVWMSLISHLVLQSAILLLPPCSWLPLKSSKWWITLFKDKSKSMLFKLKFFPWASQQSNSKGKWGIMSLAVLFVDIVNGAWIRILHSLPYTGYLVSVSLYQLRWHQMAHVLNTIQLTLSGLGATNNHSLLSSCVQIDLVPLFFRQDCSYSLQRLNFTFLV